MLYQLSIAFNVTIKLYFVFQVPLIPKADKYLLTGEDNVVRKVKNQIVAEDKYTTVEKCMMRSKNVDIQILDKTRPYKPPNEDKLKKIELLLCLSTTSRKEVTHWLPDTLPPNVKCKYILVEKLPGEYHLSEDLEDDLKKNPQISKLFTDPAIKSLPPIISPEYNNTKISDSARDSLFFTYTVVMSLYIALVNLRLSRFVPK